MWIRQLGKVCFTFCWNVFPAASQFQARVLLDRETKLDSIFKEIAVCCWFTVVMFGWYFFRSLKVTTTNLVRLFICYQFSISKCSFVSWHSMYRIINPQDIVTYTWFQGLTRHKLCVLTQWSQSKPHALIMKHQPWCALKALGILKCFLAPRIGNTRWNTNFGVYMSRFFFTDV